MLAVFLVLSIREIPRSRSQFFREVKPTTARCGKWPAWYPNPSLPVPTSSRRAGCAGRRRPKIVVCEVRENSGWQELLEETQAAQSLMLAASRHADDRLWAEVLNLGGFDVLALPFDREEPRRVLSSALRHRRCASVTAPVA